MIDQEVSYEKVESALEVLDAGCCRDEWIKVGHAIHQWDSGPDGFDLWARWSRTSDKCKPHELQRTWDGFKPDGGIKINSLFGMALDAGWTWKGSGEPSQNRARSPRKPRTDQTADEPTEAASAPPRGKDKHAGPKYLWPTIDDARAAIKGLHHVMEHPASLEFLKREYGLDGNAIDDEVISWFFFNHPKFGPGIVYIGYGPAPDRKAICKYKSFQRVEEKKRDGSIKHKRITAALFKESDSPADTPALAWPRSGAPMIIASGEEKAAAAWQMGYAVFSRMTGEAKIPEHWMPWILGQAAPSIILANDADAAGQKANATIAEQLIQAGYPRRKIHVIQWPAGVPQGYDLNDLMKGATNTQQVLADAPPMFPQNMAMPLHEFLSVPRPPLKYWIRGILPEEGKVTISAKAKGFKTTLLIELGMCLAHGNCEYLNLHFQDRARVLLVQPELSDGLLAERFNWIMNTALPCLDKRRILENFHVLETAKGRPSLWKDHPRCEQSRRELEESIVEHKADVVLIDSLYMTFAGMDENENKQMTEALDVLGELANRHHVSIILVHHFNKSGTTRGGSVFQGWGESDFSISDDENDASVFKVEVALRCAFPKGYPAIWRKPTEDTAWFQLVEDYEPETRGRKAQYDISVVHNVLREKGSMKYAALIRAIHEIQADTSESTIKRMIKKALEVGLVSSYGGNYMANAGK